MEINTAFDFSNKNIIVTGGTKGIGKAIVRSFISLNAKVFTTYRHEDDSVDTIKSECRGNLELLKLDATSQGASKKLFNWLKERIDQIDVLINNVGDALRRSPFKDSDMALWQDCFKVNLFSAVDNCHKLFPLLKSANGSVIVNVSSIAAKTSGAGDSLHYGVSKAALDCFTKGLAKEWGKYGIRVVGVGPSAIDTEFQKRLSSYERLQKIIKQTPLGRIGTVEEVASLIIFLSSQLASYISGEVIMITGGR